MEREKSLKKSSILKKNGGEAGKMRRKSGDDAHGEVMFFD